MAYNETNLKGEIESLNQQLEQLGQVASTGLAPITAALAALSQEFAKAQAACMSFSGQMTSTLPGASMLFGSMKASVQEVTVSAQGLAVSAADAAKTLNTDMYTSIRTGTTATCFFFISPLFYLLYIRDFGEEVEGAHLWQHKQRRTGRGKIFSKFLDRRGKILYTKTIKNDGGVDDEKSSNYGANFGTVSLWVRPGNGDGRSGEIYLGYDPG